jgi:hypothetical protein
VLCEHVHRFWGDVGDVLVAARGVTPDEVLGQERNATPITQRGA